MESTAQIVGSELLEDAENIAAFFQGSTGMQPEYLQLSSGKANLQYRWIDLDGVTLMWGHSTAHALWRDQMTDNGLHFGYVVSSDRNVSICGKDLRADQAMVWQPNQEMEYILAGNVHALEIGVEQRILDQLGWSFRGDALSNVSYNYLCRLTWVCTAAFRFLGMYPYLQTEFRERILDRLGFVLEPWMMASRIKHARTGSVSIPYASFRSARKILDDMNMDERLRIDDLCRELDVPRSSLHYAFRKSVGIGPRRYFELIRLQSARKTLSASKKGQTTVAAVATEHGFSDFGRFAKRYRDQFGELPGNTLLR